MIDNIINRIAKADELKSVTALQTAINNGTIPAYVGVPMIAELVKNQKEAMALQAGMPQRTVTDQVMQEAQSTMAPTQLAGIDAAQSNLPVKAMAGGGIVAFAGGDLVDDEYDPEEDDAYEEYYAEMARQEALAKLIAEDEALTQGILDDDSLDKYIGNAGTGIKYKEPIPTGGIQYTGDKDVARRHNVGNLRPSGFTYKGQVGVSPGGFAMFDSREAGIAALNQDINAKLNRGLNTPTKFISVYAPASDKNDVATYSKNVANALGIGPNDTIPNTPEARQLLANAITRQEGAQYASAKFAEGGIVGLAKGGDVKDGVKHYVLGDLVMSDFGEGVGPDPRSPAAVDEFGRDPKQVLAEKAKSAEAEKYLKDAAARNARVNPMGPPAPAQIRPAPISSAPPTWFERFYGKPTAANFASSPTAVSGWNKFLGANVIPSLIFEGGRRLGEGTMRTMADNPYFENYSDPFNGDFALGNAILKENPGAVAIVKKPEEKKVVETAKNDAIEIQQDVNQEVKKDLKSGESPLDAQAKAEQTLFEQMQEAIKKRSAALEDEKSIDNYLAVLQGFLGMMGGTSPYAMVNIGQGASSGIATLLAARKQTGLAERALGKDQAALINAQLSQQYKNAVLDQNERKILAAEKNAALVDQDRKADNYRANLQQWSKDHLQIIKQRDSLLSLKATGKLSKEQENQLADIEKEMQEADAKARKDAGYSTLYPGFKIVNKSK